MKIIKLSKGLSTMVDDEDYERLSKNKWYAYKNGKYGLYYAVRRPSLSEKALYMHHEIIGLQRGMYVDHADGNSLNNQRYNLRIANGSQNGANRSVSKSKKGPKYLGVHQRKSGRFVAFSNKNGVRYKSLTFNTPEEAALAYNELATRLHGEFARLNVIPNKDTCF